MSIPDLSQEATRRRLALKSIRLDRRELKNSLSQVHTRAETRTIAPLTVQPTSSHSVKSATRAKATTSANSILRPLSGSAIMPEIPKKPSRWEWGSRFLARAIVVILAASTLAATGAFWGVFQGMYDAKGVMALFLNDPNIKDPDAQKGDENFLLIGADTREGDNGKLGAGDDIAVEGSRSDTIILVNIPASRARVVAVSFPRDLQIDRPECAKWDSLTGQYLETKKEAETHAKLNSAYQYGGPRCLVQVIQKLSGLKITHFVGEDFEGFSKMVNAVGGVEVCSISPLYDDELGTILEKPGNQILDGEKALQYVRARKIDAEGTGDYGRIKRQQKFISSLLRRMMSQKILADPIKLHELIQAFTSRAVVSGINVDDLIELAKSMQNIPASRVTFITTPTTATSEDGMSNEVPDDEGIRAIFDSIIYDKPLPGEDGSGHVSSSVATPWTDDTVTTQPSTSTPSTPTPSPPPETQPAEGVSAVSLKKFTVQVIAPDTTVLAWAVKALTQLGFTVNTTASGVAQSYSEATIARFSPESRDAAATVASAVKGAIIERGSTPTSDVELVFGAKYPIPPIAAPAQPGQPIVIEEVKNVDGEVQLPDNLTVTNGADTTC